eukprot:798075-Prymnesium_polylepis.1
MLFSTFRVNVQEVEPAREKCCSPTPKNEEQSNVKNEEQFRTNVKEVEQTAHFRGEKCCFRERFVSTYKKWSK